MQIWEAFPLQKQSFQMDRTRAGSERSGAGVGEKGKGSGRTSGVRGKHPVTVLCNSGPLSTVLDHMSDSSEQNSS